LNEFGDLKYGMYDYIDLADRYYDRKNSESILHLEKVVVSKLNDKVARKSHPGLYLGFIDIEINAHRFPRQELVEPIPSRDPNIPMAPVSPYDLKIGPLLPTSPFRLELAPQPAKEPYKLKIFELIAGPPVPPEKLTLKE